MFKFIFPKKTEEPTPQHKPVRAEELMEVHQEEPEFDPAINELVLTQQDISSALWIKLTKHYKHRLNKSRIQNDGNLSHEETLRLRGRIAEIKALLALGDHTDTTTDD